jgi:hypothetical protein
MSEPNVTLGEWIGLAVTSGIAGMGGAMAWFKNNNLKRDERLTAVEDGMKEWDKLHAAHNTQLAVVETCQINTRDRLESIDETTSDTNRKIEKLNDTLTKFMIALKAPD